MPAEFESGLFRKIPAWHRKGVVIQNDVPLEEAIAIAGLDWNVQKKRLHLRTDEGDFTKVDYFALVRDSDKSILGYCGNRYEILQNRQAFDAMKPLVDSGEWTLETCGSLYNGKKCWALLHQENAEIVPGDVLREYLLFTWAHDGMAPAAFHPTTIRVVCANTLQMAMKASGIRIIHSASIMDKINFVRDLLRSSKDSFAVQMEVFKRLLDKTMTLAMMEEGIERIYGPRTESAAAKTKAKAKIDFAKVFVLEGHASGWGIHGMQETAYSFLNAVTELNEHYFAGRGDIGRAVVDGGAVQMANQAAFLQIKKMVGVD